MKWSEADHYKLCWGSKMVAYHHQQNLSRLNTKDWVHGEIYTVMNYNDLQDTMTMICTLLPSAYKQIFPHKTWMSVTSVSLLYNTTKRHHDKILQTPANERTLHSCRKCIPWIFLISARQWIQLYLLGHQCAPNLEMWLHRQLDCGWSLCCRSSLQCPPP